MIAEAEEMLQELESDIREYGGQELSSEKLPVPAAPAGPPAAPPEPERAGTQSAERPVAAPLISERVTAEPILPAVPSKTPTADAGPVNDTDTGPDDKESGTDKDAGGSGLNPPKEDEPTADRPGSAEAKPKTPAEKTDGGASGTETAAADDSLTTTAIPIIEPRSGS